MLGWISIVGGLLTTMGTRPSSEALFYYFRLENQIPESHLLRLTLILLCEKVTVKCALRYA